MNLSNIFVGVTLLVVLMAFFFSIKSFDKRTETGKWLGLVFGSIIVVCVSYILSIKVRNYFWSSVYSSIYFSSIDLMLVFLVRFVHAFTNLVSEKTSRIMMHSIGIIAFFDILAQCINPFYEISVHYELMQVASYTKYSYVMKTFFIEHLLFTYMMVVIVLGHLILKAVTSPAGYRRQYGFSVSGILLIVLVNAVFLYFPKDSLLSFFDYSIWGYSLTGFFLYWICFEYTSHGMMNIIRNWILEAVDQGIVLFDYQEQLILYNEKAKKQLPPKAIKENRAFTDFMKECGLQYDPENSTREHSYQFYVTTAGDEHPIRYDYRPLKNERDEVIGKLLVFTDAADEKDLLTGFMSWDCFLSTVRMAGNRYPIHRGVAVCDINNLSAVNSKYGRTLGDQAISSLADMMRKHFPSSTLFVRNNDASLIAICLSHDEAEIYQYLTEVLEEFNDIGNVNDGEYNDVRAQGAVYVLSEKGQSLLEGVEYAFRGMQARKLMDENSQHSALLNSLMRALEECDPDTSDHVQRTQILGEKLGKRIGLKDVELSSLSLLCMLHDIGKIGVPLDILNKPGKLSASEWEVIKSHAEKGYQIAKSSKELNEIADMIRHHHERWDGNGYPNGLSKESIPLLSRVIAVVDAYDAMIYTRAYRKSMTVKNALAEIYHNAGTQFDPRIAVALIDLITEEQLKSGNMQNEEWDFLEDNNDHVEAIGQRAEIPKKKHVNYQVHEITYSRYILNMNEEIIEADDNFTAMTGYTRDDWKEMTQFDLIFAEDREAYERMIGGQLKQKGGAYIEHRIRKKDNSALFVYCYGKPFYSSGNRENRVEIIITDVTRTYAVQTMLAKEQKKAKERLKHWERKYRCDSLTGLLTHEAFRNDVEVHMLDKTVKTMYLIMDVDYFKRFNDTYGHHKGDEFLINVGQMILSQMCAEDLACRLGGDEFIAAMFFKEQASRDEMIECAQRIYSKINIALTQSEGTVSLSMGVALSEQFERCTYTQLYEAADMALYESKNKGRARLTIYHG